MQLWRGGNVEYTITTLLQIVCGVCRWKHF